MSIFPEQLIRIAATGSSPRVKATLEQTQFPLLEEWQPTEENPERDLLISIAGYGLRHQAGYVPSRSLDPLPPKAPVVEKHACSLKSQEHLRMMLGGKHQELLPHWIEVLHQHNQRIPDEMLPSILTYGSNNAHKDQRDLLRLAIGERGRWLAQIANNDTWHWIFEESFTKDEEEQVYAAWGTYFRKLRERDPIHALNLVESLWDELDPLMKMSILRNMQVGLNPHDIDFLMQLLDDLTTKFTAMRWLLHIKESEFSQSMREKLKKLFVLTEIDGVLIIDYTWSDSLKGHPLHITEEEADNISVVMGYKVDRNLLSTLVPLSYWYDAYDVAPEVLIEAATHSNRQSILHRIWTNKAIHSPDRDFIFALVMNVERHAGIALVEYLSQEQLIQAAAHWLRKNPDFSLQHNAVAILNAIQQTWSEDLAHTFLDSLEAYFKKTARPLMDSETRNALEKYACYLPLSVDERFENVLHKTERNELSESEVEQLNGIISIVQFRAKMLIAIKEGTPTNTQ